MSKHIEIILQGLNVSILPLNFQADHGKSEVKWKAKDHSDWFDFDTPPITFDDLQAPMSAPTSLDGTASCTDVNHNSSGNNVPYAYHVHLIDGNGHHITYPPKDDPAKDGHPTISNKPR